MDTPLDGNSSEAYYHEAGSSEDEADWDEVEIPAEKLAISERPPIEITITTSSSKGKEKAKVVKGLSYAERMSRIDCHKLHTMSLLANAWIRNKWLNDELLHARLLSLTPLYLQNSFAMIHKSRVPDQYKRSRMFETAVTRLAEWWFSEFFEVQPFGHIRNRIFDDIQQNMIKCGVRPKPGSEEALEIEVLQDIIDDDGELIRGPKSLMKHALMGSGCRDTGAQLFTALCRALDIPARLVVSLQSVPWQQSVGKAKPKYSKKSKSSTPARILSEDEHAASSSDTSLFPGTGNRLDGAPLPKSDKAKGKEKAKPEVKLRKAKSKGRTLGKATAAVPINEDPLSMPPVFWTEVFSRPDARWMPVDSLRGTVNNRKVFDPDSAASSRSQNRMLYVVAFEEDGYGRDVTRRYAKAYSTKVAKVQGGNSKGGKLRQAWWEGVLSHVTRPYRLHRDDVEDEELDTAQLMEGFPTSIAGFKDHPLYVLPRHLKQTEAIHPAPPATPELGKFRGEPVYARSAVVQLKTAENWLRSEGRKVIQGSQPIKQVKIRAGTVNKMRELEIMKDGLREAGESSSPKPPGDVMQGLYARNQTELYVPDPVIDGIVPKNDFGNIDLYVPTMLPAGAVHIPFKGVAKIVKKLGFDYAEAVTGFEFKKRRAFPIVEGAVVARENEQTVLDAYWEAERDSEEKSRLKREERAIKHWTKLIQGLRIRQRVQEQYASTSIPVVTQAASNGPNDVEVTAMEQSESMPIGGGGFLLEADDIVQPFHLPKPQFVDNSEPNRPGNLLSLGKRNPSTSTQKDDAVQPAQYVDATMDVDDVDPEMAEVGYTPNPQQEALLIPRSMLDLAKDAEPLSVSLPPESDVLPPTLKDNTPGIETRRGTSTPARSGNGAAKDATSHPRSTRNSRKRRNRHGAEDSEDQFEDEDSSPPKRSKQATARRSIPAPTTRTLRPRKSQPIFREIDSEYEDDE